MSRFVRHFPIVLCGRPGCAMLTRKVPARPAAGAASFFPVEEVTERGGEGGASEAETRKYSDGGAIVQLEVANSFIHENSSESDHALGRAIRDAETMERWATDATMKGEIGVVQGVTAASHAEAATPAHNLVGSFVVPFEGMRRQLVAVQPAIDSERASSADIAQNARYGSLSTRRIPVVELIGQGVRALVPFCYEVTVYYHTDTNMILRITGVRSLCLENSFAMRNFLSFVLRKKREVVKALLISSGFNTAERRRSVLNCNDEGLLLPDEARVFPGVERLRLYAMLVDSLLRHDSEAGSCRGRDGRSIRAAIAKLWPQESAVASAPRDSKDLERQDILKGRRAEGLKFFEDMSHALDCTALRVIGHPEAVRFFAAEELAALEAFFPAYYLTGLGVEHVHALYLDLFEGGARKKLAEEAAALDKSWGDEGIGEATAEGCDNYDHAKPSLSPAFCMYLQNELASHCPSSLEFCLSRAADRVARGLGAKTKSAAKSFKPGNAENLEDDECEEGATSDEEWYLEMMRDREAEEAEGYGEDDLWRPPEALEGEANDVSMDEDAGDGLDDESFWGDTAALCAELEGATDAEMLEATYMAEREKEATDELDTVDWGDFEEPSHLTAREMPPPRPSDHFSRLMAAADGDDEKGEVPETDWRGFNLREIPYGYSMADYVSRPEDESSCNQSAFGIPRETGVRPELSFSAFATLAAEHPRSGISFQEVLDAAVLEQIRIYTDVVGHVGVPFIVMRTRLLQRLGIDTTTETERSRGAVDADTMRRFSNWHEAEGTESAALNKALTQAKVAFWSAAGGTSSALSALLSLSFARLSAFGAIVLADGPHADTGMVKAVPFTVDEVADTEEVATLAAAFQASRGKGGWEAERFAMSLKTEACVLLAGRMLETTVYLEKNFRYERCMIESCRAIFKRAHETRRAAISAVAGWRRAEEVIQDDLTPFERIARAMGWDHPTRKVKARIVNAFLAALEKYGDQEDAQSAALRSTVPEDDMVWIESDIIGHTGWKRRVSMCEYPPSAEQFLFIKLLELGLPMALVQGAAGAGKSYAIAHWVHMLLPGTVLFVGFMHAQKDSIAVTLTSGEFPYPDLPPGLTAHQLLSSHQFVCAGRMSHWRGVASAAPNLDRERRHGFFRTADFLTPVRGPKYCPGNRVKRVFVDEAGTMELSLATALTNLFADENCFPALLSAVFLEDTRQQGSVGGGGLGPALAKGLGAILFMNNRRYDNASSCLSMSALRGSNPDDFVVKQIGAADLIAGRADDRSSSISLVKCEPAPLFSLPTAAEFLARNDKSPALKALAESRMRARVATAQGYGAEAADEDMISIIDRELGAISDSREADTPALLPQCLPEGTDLLSRQQLSSAIAAGAEAARTAAVANSGAEPVAVNAFSGRPYALVGGGGGELEGASSAAPMEVDEEGGGWGSDIEGEDASMQEQQPLAFSEYEDMEYSERHERAIYEETNDGYFSDEEGYSGDHFTAPTSYRDPHSEHSMAAMQAGGRPAAPEESSGLYGSGTQWMHVIYDLAEKGTIEQENTLIVTSTNKEARLAAAVCRPFFAAGMPEIAGTDFFVGERLALVGKNFSRMGLENRSIIRLLGAVRVNYIFLNASVTKDLVTPLVISSTAVVIDAIARACRPRVREGEGTVIETGLDDITCMNSVPAATMRLLLSDVDAEATSSTGKFDTSQIAAAINDSANTILANIEDKSLDHGLDFLEVTRLVHRSLISQTGGKAITGDAAKIVNILPNVPQSYKSYQMRVALAYKRVFESTGDKKAARKASFEVLKTAVAEAYETLTTAVFSAVCTRIFLTNLAYVTRLSCLSSDTRELPPDDTRLASTADEYFATKRRGGALHAPMPRAALKKAIERARLVLQKSALDVSASCYLATTTPFLQGRAPKSLGEIRLPTSKQKNPTMSNHSVRAFLSVRAEGEGQLAYVPENPEVTGFLRSPVARTSHAAQSQDEPHVYLVLGSSSMATHKLVYTGVTRHERTCCILDDGKMFPRAFTDEAVLEAEYSLLGIQLRASVVESWRRRIANEDGGEALERLHAVLEEARARQIEETRLEPTLEEAQAVEEIMARRRDEYDDYDEATSAATRRTLLGQAVIRRALRCNRSAPMLLPWEGPLQDVLSPTHVAAAAVADVISGGATLRFDPGDRAMIPRGSSLYGVSGPPGPVPGADAAHLQHTWLSTPLAAIRARVAAAPPGKPLCCSDISPLFPDTAAFSAAFRATVFE